MHGMINRAVERFVRDTYGDGAWMNVVRALGLDFTEIEPMLIYGTELTDQLLAAIATHLNKEREDLLEDIGTFLVSHPNLEAIRRLLRFGGVDFPEFLHSLDDLPGRARLAVPDLHLPGLELREHRAGYFSLNVNSEGLAIGGFGYVVLGLLRAMADDYGALVVLEHKGCNGQIEILEIRLLDAAFARGREFDLSNGPAA